MVRNSWARRAILATAGLGLLGVAAIYRPEVGGAEPRGRALQERELEQPMKVTGIVDEFATNKHDDIDGLLLKDGTVVKFPPHQGDDLEALVKPGDEVRIAGRRHETPEGEVHLHADKITLTATGKSLERDEPAPPPPPRAKKHERHGPKDAVPPHEQILAELRSLRKLIESQQK